jgi:hypothetical protein
MLILYWFSVGGNRSTQWKPGRVLLVGLFVSENIRIKLETLFLHVNVSEVRQMNVAGIESRLKRGERIQ